jgi:hypothetical protein
MVERPMSEMLFTRAARLAAAIAGMLIAGGAVAQTVAPAAVDLDAVDAAAVDPSEEPDFSVLGEPTPDIRLRSRPAAPASLLPQPGVIGSRSEKTDGSVSVSAGHRLPTDWVAKIGVDVGLAAPAPIPDALRPGQAQDHGTGWANVAVPAAPIGWDTATIDARVDPSADQGRLSTALTRAVPIGGGVSLKLQNGYSVTQTLANPSGIPATPNASATAPAATHVFSGDGGVRLELPTATALSAGARLSSTDERLLPSVSAEQKLFDTPLSITGSISQRPTGETDRSITAGFRRTW